VAWELGMRPGIPEPGSSLEIFLPLRFLDGVQQEIQVAVDDSNRSFKCKDDSITGRYTLPALELHF
jgi:hypothetical protein